MLIFNVTLLALGVCYGAWNAPYMAVLPLVVAKPAMRKSPRVLIYLLIMSFTLSVWHGGEQSEAALLESAYRRSFEVALENNISSIDFPAISTGVYGYPKLQAAEIALKVMWLYSPQFQIIMIACFSAADAELYKKLS